MRVLPMERKVLFWDKSIYGGHSLVLSSWRGSPSPLIVIFIWWRTTVMGSFTTFVLSSWPFIYLFTKKSRTNFYFCRILREIIYSPSFGMSALYNDYTSPNILHRLTAMLMVLISCSWNWARVGLYCITLRVKLSLCLNRVSLRDRHEST